MTTIKQVQNILRLTFGIVPIVAGLDKFTNLLADWPRYLGANITGMLPVSATVFMKIVGVVEIIAGILVLLRPLIGAYVVMVWLCCIALQLIIGGHFFDVAVRDLVMAVGALTLAKLTMMSGSENIQQAKAMAR
ncbi:MAG TPA: hypothetical protein VK622_10535 [Puia sp.]|nr:hypothetical protein [Puia sp.]